jgi:hypothetical protein
MTENSPGDHSGAFDNQRVERDQLPLPDYDHLPLASLIQRIRSLDAEGLRLLLTYETSHGSRLPIVDALQTRQAELAEGMNPSSGSPDALAPERSGPPPNPRTIDPTRSSPTIKPPPTVTRQTLPSRAEGHAGEGLPRRSACDPSGMGKDSYQLATCRESVL